MPRKPAMTSGAGAKRITADVLRALAIGTAAVVVGAIWVAVMAVMPFVAGGK